MPSGCRPGRGVRQPPLIFKLTLVIFIRANRYFEHGPYAWDLAAASLLCAEAGACVTDMRGNALDLCGRNVLVAVPKLQQLLLQALKDVPAPTS